MTENTVLISNCSVLGLVLVILKLLGVLNISWLWVLSPFWLPLAISLTVCFAFFLFLTLFCAGDIIRWLVSLFR